VPVVKDPIEGVLERSQKAIEASPALVLGSGASVAYGVPSMGALSQHLRRINVDDMDETNQRYWDFLMEKLRETDLESALQETFVTQVMTSRIVTETWSFLVPSDLEVFRRIILDRGHLALTRLLRHLFQSTQNKISIITTNYDRLAEYASDAMDTIHLTGFGFGHLRWRHPLQHKLSIRKNGFAERIVQIWKVHGSLDWFADGSGEVFALPVVERVPEGLTPVMVTPGIEKYRRTHDEPFRSILGGADEALIEARAYLCIGYGFNDTHIQPKLVEKCRKDEVPLVILARELTPAARRFLQDSGCRTYLAFEASEDGDGTRVLMPEEPASLNFPGRSLWQLDTFLDHVI
jgi:hypothetical protein